VTFDILQVSKAYLIRFSVTAMSSLEKAISITAQAHAGQRDKAGAPYILHPLRVMLKMTTDQARIVAVLHDLIEDTDWTIERLVREGFHGEILAALDCLTRREGEGYEAFIQRVRLNPLAVTVKIADLEDNMDGSRLKEVTEADEKRISKYKNALQELTNHR
jgi:(p)ppGpp synthase/HD superfamily hydrolase